MQLDQETIRWILSGFFIAAGTIISWLIGRQVLQIGKQIEKQDKRIDTAHSRIDDAHTAINSVKLDVAEKYVSKIDLENQLNTHLSPIRDDMRELKGDVKALLQRS